MKQSKNLATGALGSDVSDYLRTADVVDAQPRLVFDWNLNRYTTPTADNTPSEDTNGFDIETFPIESLYSLNRPTKGINKAIVNQAVVASRYADSSDVKFYVGSADDIYKYWTSPQPTDGTATFPLHTDSITVARPRVEYPSVLQVNKIVVKFETTWATPDDFNVQIKTTTGGSYSNIGGTSPAIDNLGVCTLYYNGTAWVTTRPTNLVTTGVAGIKLVVRTMKGGTDRSGNPTTYIKVNTNPSNPSTLGQATTHTTDGKNSNLNVISIEPHFESDLTDRLIGDTNTFDFSTTSQLYPVGTLTSNDGTISLSNDDHLLDEKNTSSPYYGLLRQNAEVNLDYVFTIGADKFSVQGYKMYTGLWEPNSDGIVNVSITDYTKFFNDDKPRAFMWENKSVTEIVWRICDSVGFVDYEIQLEDVTTDHTIPVFWSDGTKTVWEIFNELAEVSQTAIYIDSYGKLQVRVREAAFNTAASPSIHLFGRDTVSDIANIIDVQPSAELHNNKITATYRATDWKVGSTGKPALDYVWQPDDDLVVRAAPLQQDIVNTSDKLWLDQKTVAVWPYKSKVEIDGEIIQYDGKEYIYWTDDVSNSGTVRNVVWVESQDDIKKYDKLSHNDVNKNTLSGALKITERGVWNSDQRDHTIDVNSWSTREVVYTGDSGGVGADPRGFKFNRTESTVSIDTPGNMKRVGDTFWVYRGSAAQSSYKMYGTRIRYPKSGDATQRAGIAFQLTNSFDGYYVEIIPSNKIANKDYKNTSEVQIWSVVNGNWKKITQGKHTAIRQPKWYDVDVYVNHGGQDTITVYINGRAVASGTTNNNTKQGSSARVAMYARGKTKVDYEYFYAVNKNITEPLDGYGFWDLKNGGMRGSEWELEMVWEKHTLTSRRKRKNSTKNKANWTGYLFDEFGPYVHEVREFDVKFDPAPVQYSQLFMTNRWDAAPVEYISNSFGARFVIANVSRNNAILQGEDNLIFNSGSAVNQVCAILGRDLIAQDDEEVTAQDDANIRIDGEVEVELTSDWLQTKEMSEDVTDWMKDHWSKGVDQLEVTVFGNPCYELADVADIDWPAENMAPSDFKYFVVGIQTQFASGITTTLTLRRVQLT